MAGSGRRSALHAFLALAGSWRYLNTPPARDRSKRSGMLKPVLARYLKPAGQSGMVFPLTNLSSEPHNPLHVDVNYHAPSRICQSSPCCGRISGCTPSSSTVRIHSRVDSPIGLPRPHVFLDQTACQSRLVSCSSLTRDSTAKLIWCIQTAVPNDEADPTRRTSATADSDSVGQPRFPSQHSKYTGDS